MTTTAAAPAEPRAGRGWTALAWGAGALAICLLLALRSMGQEALARRLDPDFFLTDVRLQVAWIALYYATWAALTPFVFATVRWFPFDRGRRLRALLFHLPVSVAVASLVFGFLVMFFGSAVLGFDWPEPASLLRPTWMRVFAVRALTDTLMYWLVLASGHALRLHDEDRARRLRAAELERSLVAAQVDSLKMKLQPHFLFNTLNSISFLAVERDTAAVVTMIERLASLLRASMSSNRHLVPLDEELSLLDQYLSIEEIRFGDRLRVARRIDPAARRARVPSLILQPVVENSIKHGFSRRMDASRLDIDVARDCDELVVTVADDGPGLPPGWNLATHCGRGLRNVIERLDAIYRGGWSFSLENRAGGGTVATLRIPFARVEAEEGTTCRDGSRA
ncbi:MAG: lytS1 [Acidobacteria bacterium]|nr:lytS1 [Acidobacteriota bacterium]